MNNLDVKLDKLLNSIRQMQSVVVGFSGGVDSTFLAAAAFRALGEKALAITAYSETLSQSEQNEAVEIAKVIGIPHVLLHVSELNSPEFVANNKDRCYYCKKERFSALQKWAKEHDYQYVLEGSNHDDLSDYRPGMRAVAELDAVASPLLEVGLTKEEIRRLSKEWNLPTWNKLSAACLASRMSYGLEVTADRLGQVEQAEEVVRKLCNGQVRVRHHGNLARIEVSPQDINCLVQPENAQKVTKALKELGFNFVTLDLLGYRTGSMNETLSEV